MQNTEILFDWEQIHAAKYKFQVINTAQGLEPMLFPESTFRFFYLDYLTADEEDYLWKRYKKIN